MRVKYEDWLFGKNGALLRAAAIGDTELARDLVAQGANVNVASRNGCTPLHMAAQNGHVEIVRILLESGAIPTPDSPSMQCPRSLAVHAGHHDIAQLLP